jgi:hypothetical protein
VRWRILITAVLLLIASVVYWTARPRKGNVEYHQRRYLAALRPSALEPLVEKMPWGVQEAFRDRQVHHIEFHRQALIDAGYLGEKAYPVSNRPPHEVANSILLKLSTTNPRPRTAGFFLIRFVDDQSITIVGPREQMDGWDELVREAERPKP